MADAPNGGMLGQSSAPLEGGESIFPNGPGDQNVGGTGPDFPKCFGDDNEFVVFAKNARVRTKVQLTQLLAELSSITWDIILFSETRAVSGK